MKNGNVPDDFRKDNFFLKNVIDVYLCKVVAGFIGVAGGTEASKHL
jgi:hypothetical protein